MVTLRERPIVPTWMACLLGVGIGLFLSGMLVAVSGMDKPVSTSPPIVSASANPVPPLRTCDPHFGLPLAREELIQIYSSIVSGMESSGDCHPSLGCYQEAIGRFSLYVSALRDSDEWHAMARESCIPAGF